MHPKISYNHCGVCGYTPRSKDDAPNFAPLRWWDPDDGYKIGTLCIGCEQEYADVKPKPGDLAYSATNGIGDHVDTDEDVTHLILP